MVNRVPHCRGYTLYRNNFQIWSCSFLKEKDTLFVSSIWVESSNRRRQYGPEWTRYHVLEPWFKRPFGRQRFIWKSAEFGVRSWRGNCRTEDSLTYISIQESFLCENTIIFNSISNLHLPFLSLGHNGINTATENKKLSFYFWHKKTSIFLDGLISEFTATTNMKAWLPSFAKNMKSGRAHRMLISTKSEKNSQIKEANSWMSELYVSMLYWNGRLL